MASTASPSIAAATRADPTRTPLDRAPAVPVALAVAAGIACDRVASLPVTTWLAAATLALLAAVVLERTGRAARWSAALVLLVWLSLGGLRQHFSWSVRDPDNVVSCLTTERQPARLVARACSAVVIAPADQTRQTPPWLQVDRSICLAECRSLGTAGQETPVTGKVRIDVTGHLLNVQPGDLLEAFGVLQRPAGQRNPGGLDYAASLRGQGLDALFHVEHPDHVLRLERSPDWMDHFRQERDALRRECEWIFISRLKSSLVPLAMSLLLGDRTGLRRDVARQFAESGTMHLLAISGLHVGILAGLLSLVCRLLQTRGGTTAAVLLAGIVGYALLTDQRPPVIRATLLATLVLSAQTLGRSPGGYQLLALCALGVLLWNPADLFDPGAQLSFVAVWGIVWAGRRESQRQLAQLTAPDAADEAPARRSWLLTFRAGVRQAYLVTGAIWLFTLPLTMWHFHLVSPVGLLVNVLLIPWTAVMLAAGYVMLLTGLVHPLLAVWPATIFSLLLEGLLGIVRASAAAPWGHVWGPAPPGWWLCGCYGLLAGATQLIPTPWSQRRVWRGLGGWTVLGLVWGLIPQPPGELRCTFLSVGHGCAVLIETPSGRTLQYDAGAFSDGFRATRAVSEALWSRGGQRLDAVILSHADIDHYNGLPGLVEQVPIGGVYFSPTFLDFRQRLVRETCDEAARAGIPLRLVQAGDRLRLDPDVACEILHPAGNFDAQVDNANSVVLRITYAGRTLLLTGDLEGAGLPPLLREPTAPVDVLLSPHHGSLAANDPRLVAWARPGIVILSTGETESLDRVRGRYSSATRMFSTARSGAVTIRVRPTGELLVEEMSTLSGID